MTSLLPPQSRGVSSSSSSGPSSPPPSSRASSGSRFARRQSGPSCPSGSTKPGSRRRSLGSSSSSCSCSPARTTRPACSRSPLAAGLPRFRSSSSASPSKGHDFLLERSSVIIVVTIGLTLARRELNELVHSTAGATRYAPTSSSPHGRSTASARGSNAPT